MTVKYQECEGCGKYDITGTIPCNSPSQLCPDCASKVLQASPEEVRASLEKKLAGVDNGRQRNN